MDAVMRYPKRELRNRKGALDDQVALTRYWWASRGNVTLDYGHRLFLSLYRRYHPYRRRLHKSPEATYVNDSSETLSKEPGCDMVPSQFLLEIVSNYLQNDTQIVTT